MAGLPALLGNSQVMLLSLHVVFPAGVDPSGSTWQPWTDQLVYAVLAGLVWGGARLAAAEEEHARVMEAAAAYMAARPIQVSMRGNGNMQQTQPAQHGQTRWMLHLSWHKWSKECCWVK